MQSDEISILNDINELLETMDDRSMEAGTSQSTERRQSRSTPTPYIRIVEQPAGKALRFRYECEGRLAGSIPGVNSTPENKTYPTVEIVGYQGTAVVVVSCVTKEKPYRPHPHELVGKDGCQDGICKTEIHGDSLRAVFSNLGIRCVKRRDIKTALSQREKKHVDPFNTKFTHADQPGNIDLNAVRLCFQAFVKLKDRYKQLAPVVSEPIYDKKAMSELVINRLCSYSAKVGGGDEIILLCEKVAKDDISVRFFELNNQGIQVWTQLAQFQQSDVHKQTAIAFKTPRYHSAEVKENSNIFIQLERPSDKMTSKPLRFEYYPDPDEMRRKRLRHGGSDEMNILRKKLQECSQLQENEFSIPTLNVSNTHFQNQNIKTEPTALTNAMYDSWRSPTHTTPSPQPVSPLNRNTITPSPRPMTNYLGGMQYPIPVTDPLPSFNQDQHQNPNPNPQENTSHLSNLFPFIRNELQDATPPQQQMQVVQLQVQDNWNAITPTTTTFMNVVKQHSPNETPLTNLYNINAFGAQNQFQQSYHSLNHQLNININNLNNNDSHLNNMDNSNIKTTFQDPKLTAPNTSGGSFSPILARDANLNSVSQMSPLQPQLMQQSQQEPLNELDLGPSTEVYSLSSLLRDFDF